MASMLFLPSVPARQDIPGYSGLALNERLVRSQLPRCAKSDWRDCFSGVGRADIKGRRRSPASSRRPGSARIRYPLPKDPVLNLGAKCLQAARKLVKGLGELWVDLPGGRNLIIGMLLYKRFEVSCAVNFVLILVGLGAQL